MSDPTLSLTWIIQGISDDGSNNLLIVPQSYHGHGYPPLHLFCVLDNENDFQALSHAWKACHQPAVRRARDDMLEIIQTRLENWSNSRAIRLLLNNIAMGSTIHISSISDPAQEATIWLSPNISLQERYLTLRRLSGLWASYSLEYPPCLDIQQIKSVRRLHDSVSLVTIPNEPLMVFKSAVSIVSRMYHELRELLRMPHHPNVIGKPRYIVTRNGKEREEPVVCGFILEFHSGGTLLDRLSCSSTYPRITTKDKLKWIRQILQALRHIHCPGGSFYPELRLENIMLSHKNDIVLVDLEQFGGPERWLHPHLGRIKEVYNDNWKHSRVNPSCMPSSIFYSNPAAGYMLPFANASGLERQTFENYSLAKVMWCIFEEQTNSATRLDGDSTSNSGEPQIMFPHFEKTPERMRYWIWVCTRSSREWGDMMCKCEDGQPDICEHLGAKLQTNNMACISLEEAEEYLHGVFGDLNIY
ncbi:hypothetical protein FGSG_04814 [Fusarium graminearum PH-1]|uniref:Chromosome 3, complete genome n=1 Tax=Gibberella zeae (strain ATCC MYA-4620 / CBS 123657 / FGSC 9075 / NRRL 31084 / PH-1) TaxID=229533 RepID=I1RLK9_GIBZE|nr:hypothetical protein FGSG_04814 [Fusarium graminearum PH-1]ESU10688.1 hypothetical protein FGSG_04814 [Fusarium graminearum PH-1]EYB27094.1 hypothetical protein FG05_04814 [Fusarium graminearum]CEF86791.1 unnamed protein product [Fusarium graminearum]|eukprot:XP_011323264.1 hypothetical protein FGSG_04814 [Fusarium graminearum PH-1]